MRQVWRSVSKGADSSSEPVQAQHGTHQRPFLHFANSIRIVLSVVSLTCFMLSPGWLARGKIWCQLESRSSGRVSPSKLISPPSPTNLPTHKSGAREPMVQILLVELDVHHRIHLCTPSQPSLTGSPTHTNHTSAPQVAEPTYSYLECNKSRS